MAATLKLPVGIEDFKKIRRQGFYYIDKTRLIRTVSWQMEKGKSFIRPRRFGKTVLSFTFEKDSKFDTALINEEDVPWN